MGESKWIHAWVVGIGECAFWAEPEVVAGAIAAGVQVEVENMTMCIPLPDGRTAFRPLAKDGTLHSGHVAFFAPPPEPYLEPLSGAWDQTRKPVILAGANDIPKFPKRK